MTETNQVVQTPTQQLFDKTRSLAMTAGVHSLTPPNNLNIDPAMSIQIVKALESDPVLQDRVADLLGFMYVPLDDVESAVQFRPPVMNKLGIGNFINVCKSISKDYEFSNIHEDEIPKRILHLFSKNIPYFFVYYKEFGLARSDFNIIETSLFSIIDSILHKAKGGGHRNVIRGTYSEDTLGKILKGSEQQAKETGGFLSNLNPFKKRG